MFTITAIFNASAKFFYAAAKKTEDALTFAIKEVYENHRKVRKLFVFEGDHKPLVCNLRGPHQTFIKKAQSF